MDNNKYQICKFRGEDCKSIITETLIPKAVYQETGSGMHLMYCYVISDSSTLEEMAYPSERKKINRKRKIKDEFNIYYLRDIESDEIVGALMGHSPDPSFLCNRDKNLMKRNGHNKSYFISCYIKPEHRGKKLSKILVETFIDDININESGICFFHGEGYNLHICENLYQQFGVKFSDTEWVSFPYGIQAENIEDE
jgi:hypothetical protein